MVKLVIRDLSLPDEIIHKTIIWILKGHIAIGFM